VIFPSPPPYENQAIDAALALAIVVTAVVIVVVIVVVVAVFGIHIIISDWKLEHRYPAAPVAPAVAPIARAKVVPYDSESIV
jgi:amino acid transporter